MVTHVCYRSTQEVRAGGSKILSHPQLYSEFKVSLSYMRSCIRKIKRRKNKEKKQRLIKCSGATGITTSTKCMSTNHLQVPTTTFLNMFIFSTSARKLFLSQNWELWATAAALQKVLAKGPYAALARRDSTVFSALHQASVLAHCLSCPTKGMQCRGLSSASIILDAHSRHSLKQFLNTSITFRQRPHKQYTKSQEPTHLHA